MGEPAHLYFNTTQVTLPAVFNASRPDRVRVSSLPLADVAATVPLTLDVGGQTTQLSFHYYSVSSFQPLAAPIRGGTVISVFGTEFFPDPVDNVTQILAAVRFVNNTGFLIVPMSVINTTLAQFYMPSAASLVNASQTPKDRVEFFVSLNGGQQWTPVPGSMFFYSPPSISRTQPVSGPTTGGTRITVTGSFPNTGTIAGRLNGSLFSCQRLSQTSASCVTVPLTGGATGSVSLEITVDGDTTDIRYTTDSVSFFAYSPPQNLSIDPPIVPHSIASWITISGLVCSASDFVSGGHLPLVAGSGRYRRPARYQGGPVHVDESALCQRRIQLHHAERLSSLAAGKPPPKFNNADVIDG
jgi:hypothetical protein